jgi:ABC-2 type transport system permease protein
LIFGPGFPFAFVIPILNIPLLRKSLAEARLLLGGLGGLLFAVCWLRVFIVSRLQTGQFAAIIEQVWEQLRDFWPVPLDQLLTYTGRIAVGYNEPIIVFGVSLFAIARGSDVVSGELSRGTLEMLLAQPVSRLQVLVSQSLITVAGLGLLCFLTWGGTAAGIYTTRVQEDLPPPSIGIPGIGIRIPLSFRKPEKVLVPMREKTRPGYFVAGAFNLFCLGIALAGFSAFVSACDRYRWRTIGVVVSVYVVSLVLKLLGQAIREVAWLQRLSLFTAYEPQKFVSIAVHDPRHGWALALFDSQGRFLEPGPLGYNLILLAIGGLCYVFAAIAFTRRDLPAPL